MLAYAGIRFILVFTWDMHVKILIYIERLILHSNTRNMVGSKYFKHIFHILQQKDRFFLKTFFVKLYSYCMQIRWQKSIFKRYCQIHLRSKDCRGTLEVACLPCIRWKRIKKLLYNATNFFFIFHEKSKILLLF